MTTLPASLAAWNTIAFKSIIKQELLDLTTGTLPLEKGTSQGGYVDDSDLNATILTISENPQTITVTAGLFFTEIIICCGCGDDPTPVHAYCDMEISIDKNSAHASFRII